MTTTGKSSTATEMCAHCQTPIKGDETHCSGCGNELIAANRVPVQAAVDEGGSETEETTDTTAGADDRTEDKPGRSGGRLSDVVPRKKK